MPVIGLNIVSPDRQSRWSILLTSQKVEWGRCHRLFRFSESRNGLAHRDLPTLAAAIHPPASQHLRTSSDRTL
jgi:hypothetical protein